MVQLVKLLPVTAVSRMNIHLNPLPGDIPGKAAEHGPSTRSLASHEIDTPGWSSWLLAPSGSALAVVII